MLAHRHNLGNDCLVGPFNTEDFSELLQVLGRRFTDGENSVAQPAHAQAAKLLVEELYAELRGEEGDVFDDSEANAPLLVFGELNDGGEKGLREKLDSDDCRKLVHESSVLNLIHTVVDRLELGDDVQTDIRELIFEHLEEHWKEV